MTLVDAFNLVARLHAGQTDQAGQPYILHLVRVFLRVCELGGDRDQQFAALFHDAIEDGKTTAAWLLECGVPPGAVEIVVVLTRDPRQPYWTYIEGVKRHPKAPLVKRGDLDDNEMPERLALLPADVAERLKKKYSRAREQLCG